MFGYSHAQLVQRCREVCDSCSTQLPSSQAAYRPRLRVSDFATHLLEFIYDQVGDVPQNAEQLPSETLRLLKSFNSREREAMVKSKEFLPEARERAATPMWRVSVAGDNRIYLAQNLLSLVSDAIAHRTVG